MSEQPCADGQIDVYMGNYWACTCGWISDFPVGTDRSTAHNKPVPQNVTLQKIGKGSQYFFDKGGVTCLFINIDDGRFQAMLPLSSIEEGIQQVRAQELAQQILTIIEDGPLGTLDTLEAIETLCKEHLQKES